MKFRTNKDGEVRGSILRLAERGHKYTELIRPKEHIFPLEISCDTRDSTNAICQEEIDEFQDHGDSNSVFDEESTLDSDAESLTVWLKNYFILVSRRSKSVRDALKTTPGIICEQYMAAVYPRRRSYPNLIPAGMEVHNDYQSEVPAHTFVMEGPSDAGTTVAIKLADLDDVVNSSQRSPASSIS